MAPARPEDGATMVRGTIQRRLSRHQAARKAWTHARAEYAPRRHALARMLGAFFAGKWGLRRYEDAEPEAVEALPHNPNLTPAQRKAAKLARGL